MVTVVIPTRSRRPLLSTVEPPGRCAKDVALEVKDVALEVIVLGGHLHHHMAVSDRSPGNIASLVRALLDRRGFELARGLVRLVRSRPVEDGYEVVQPCRLTLYSAHAAPS